MKQRLTVNTLALGNLKKRKKQYTSLILGIILAMVFSSSVLLMVSSMVESTRKMEQDTYGKQNGIYFNVRQPVPLRGGRCGSFRSCGIYRSSSG